jgi:hypothetical protein
VYFKRYNPSTQIGSVKMLPQLTYSTLRLRELLARPGGITLDEPVARADIKLDELRAESIEDGITASARLCARITKI